MCAITLDVMLDLVYDISEYGNFNIPEIRGGLWRKEDTEEAGERKAGLPD